MFRGRIINGGAKSRYILGHRTARQQYAGHKYCDGRSHVAASIHALFTLSILKLHFFNFSEILIAGKSKLKMPEEGAFQQATGVV